MNEGWCICGKHDATNDSYNNVREHNATNDAYNNACEHNATTNSISREYHGNQ